MEKPVAPMEPKILKAEKNELGRGNLFARPCPSREILKHVCSRWGVLILVALREKTLRFSDLRRKLDGVSEKMLAQTLQSLTRDGFVLRQSKPVVPPFVEYSLTPMGNEISDYVLGITDWIEENLSRVAEAHEQHDQQEAL